MECQPGQAIEILSRTPAALSTVLKDLPQDLTDKNEGAETWSPYDIIGHLIHGEETDWIPRAKIILEHGRSRPFQPFDRFAQFERFKGKPLNELLDTFAHLREKNLKILQQMDITPVMLKLTGIHPEFGPVTLGQLLATWVVHDLGHIGQIVRVMSRQYFEAVGPWKAYLTVLGS